MSILNCKSSVCCCNYFLHSVSFISMEKSELKKRRERLGLTQTRLARIIGISANTVSRYETGTMVIPKNMELILEALEKRHIEDFKRAIARD